jgi:hypothetical protein
MGTSKALFVLGGKYVFYFAYHQENLLIMRQMRLVSGNKSGIFCSLCQNFVLSSQNKNINYNSSKKKKKQSHANYTTDKRNQQLHMFLYVLENVFTLFWFKCNFDTYALDRYQITTLISEIITRWYLTLSLIIGVSPSVHVQSSIILIMIQSKLTIIA